MIPGKLPRVLGRPPFATVDPFTGLSDRARRVLQVIVAQSVDGPTSQRRIAAQLGIRNRAVEQYLRRLGAKNLVRWRPTPGPASVVATAKGVRWAER